MLNGFLIKEQKQFSEGKTTFSTNGAGATGRPPAKNMNLDLSLTPYTKLRDHGLKM